RVIKHSKGRARGVQTYIRVIKHSKGRARGVQTYIFAQDMPITDFQFELMRERLVVSYQLL
ncbi:hypothetical protein K1I73_06240, partial [Streptococcus gordonii]|nr:hypothetical protein [Streptococcus gordonii]